MRWSRHHDDSSLGELMGTAPDAADEEEVTSSPVAARDDDSTAVRLYPFDYTGDPAGSGVPDEPTSAADEAGSSLEDDGSFLDDEDYLPQERRGPGRLTVALVAALVLAIGVLGGVWVQKQLGSSQSFGAAGGQGVTRRAAGGQGMPGGGAAGGQGMPGGDAPAASGGDASSGSGTGAAPETGSGASASGTSTTPAVVGTVSSTSTKALVVTDLGGTKHTVTVTSATTLTAPYGHGSLARGDTVAISGSTSSDGSVTATGVTVS